MLVYVKTYNSQKQERTQPFTAPIEIPLTKYFWKKGYTHTIGIVTSIVVAARMDWVEIRDAWLDVYKRQGLNCKTHYMKCIIQIWKDSVKRKSE